jgi:hypothetical protein
MKQVLRRKEQVHASLLYATTQAQYKASVHSKMQPKRTIPLPLADTMLGQS